jgi:hypothetical protein
MINSYFVRHAGNKRIFFQFFHGSAGISPVQNSDISYVKIPEIKISKKKETKNYDYLFLIPDLKTITAPKIQRARMMVVDAIPVFDGVIVVVTASPVWVGTGVFTRVT